MSKIGGKSQSLVATKMREWIGKVVIWRPPVRGQPREAMGVTCICVNLSFAYGNWDALIVPVAGVGSRWVTTKHLEQITPPVGFWTSAAIADLEARANAENHA